MKKPKVFETADFVAAMCADRYIPEFVAELANAKLDKMIETWPVVTRQDLPIIDCWKWGETNSQNRKETHTARLAFIEEIKKELCPHRVRLNSFSWVDGKTREVLAKTQMTSHCELCGVELQATWSEKK